MHFFLAFLVLLAGCSSQPEPSLQIDEAEGGYLVQEAGSPVLFYRLAPKSLDGRYERSNYIHPLYGLDGEELTEDFPEDHLHHRGVFWTWHQVRIGDVRAGDPWLASRFSWRVQGADILPSGNGLRVVHRWFSPDFENGIEPILEEAAQVIVHPASAQFRLIDFDIRLVPLQDRVSLGGSEDDKGYGGFSVRVKLPEDLRFTTAAGPVRPARLAVSAGDWVDFSADFGGHGRTSGVAVLVHPASAGYPQRWVLRGPATPSMQNPVWPGAEPVGLPRGEEVRLRYRLVLHRGDAARVDLDAIQRAYAAQP